MAEVVTFTRQSCREHKKKKGGKKKGRGKVRKKNPLLFLNALGLLEEVAGIHGRAWGKKRGREEKKKEKKPLVNLTLLRHHLTPYPEHLLLDGVEPMKKKGGKKKKKGRGKEGEMDA